MPDIAFVNLLAVLVVAVAAPLLLGLAPAVRVPAVVLEIVLGIVVGPSVLGWVRADLAVQTVALLGLAMLLFLAGAAVGLLDRDSRSHPHFRVKLEAIGYGFLVPVFFVASGLRLDVEGLVSSGSALARVPVLVLALLLARGVPALLYLRWFGRRGTVAAALLQATSLPFLVTATQIGVVTGQVEPATAAGLVCAGLVSVLVFPATAAALLGGAQSRSSTIVRASR